MGIDIQGDGHTAVPQPLLDNLGMDTGQEQERRMGMPQIMEANPLQPSHPGNTAPAAPALGLAQVNIISG